MRGTISKDIRHFATAVKGDAMHYKHVWNSTPRPQRHAYRLKMRVIVDQKNKEAEAAKPVKGLVV